MNTVPGDGVPLGAEEVLVVDRSADRVVDFGMVVDEVGQGELLAVKAFVRPGPAEPYMPRRDAGALVEVVGVEPAQGARLHPGTALGNQPDTSAEQPHEARDRGNGIVHFRRGEHGGLVTGEEGRVASVGVAGAVDDYPAYIDAQAGLAAAVIWMHEPSLPGWDGGRNYRSLT